MNEQDKAFLHDLQKLSNTIQPDAEFLNRLEDQLFAKTQTPPERTVLFPFRARKWIFLAASLSIILLLVTPTLRSLAQDLLEFFNRDDNDTFPVTPLADSSTWDAAMQETRVTAADAEKMVGFDILVPAEFPLGYDLLGVLVAPDKDFISLDISSPPGRFLMINQWPVDSMVNNDNSTWGKIAQSADVQIVSIHGVRGEYVEGGWAVFPGEEQAQWLPDASERRLRWQEGDMMFEITVMGGAANDLDIPSYGYLDQQKIMALAESMR